jgi:hypothetical protein
MRFAFAIILASVSPALADPAPAKPEAAKVEPAKPACTYVTVGRGLDRHRICQIDTPVIVKPESQRPKVIIVNDGGRKVVGPPRVTDPLIGLSHSLH